MRDKLIIGRMIPTGSRVHDLDPRAKITAMLLFTAALILSNAWLPIAILALLSIVVLLATKVPLKMYARTLRPMRWLMLFVFLFQLFAGAGAEAASGAGAAAVWTWGPITLSAAGLSAALLAVSRMALLIAFTAMLTFTTTPSMLSRGIEGMIKPLSRKGMGAERFSLMMRLALRFIPALLEEAQTILKAQAARGADYEEMKLKEKARLLLSLLVPVTVGAFRRAEELTTSLEARGYRIGAPRTAYRQLVWRGADTRFTVLFALLPAGALLLRLAF